MLRIYNVIDGVLFPRSEEEINNDLEPAPQEQTDALILDHEERLIYLELGVNE